MDTTRQQKINRLIQRELGEIFQRESHNLFEGAMITATIVRISSDMSYVKVYLSIFAPGREASEILEVVKSQTKKIRAILGNKTRNQLRIIPELSFFIDDSLDYIENIENILKK